MTHPGSLHLGPCETCGKHRFANRRQAKRAARYLHPHDTLRAYRCGQHWHYGHTPAWIVRGETGPERSRT